MARSTIRHQPTLLFVLSSQDVTYAALMSKAGFRSTHLVNERPVTWTHARMLAQRYGADCIATTQFPFFGLVEGTHAANYGYVWERDGVRVLYLPPLVSTVKQPHGKWLIELYLSKLHSPHKFYKAPAFRYTRLGAHNLDTFVELANRAVLTAVDVETHRVDAMLTHCAYSMLLPNGQVYSCAIEVFPDWEHGFHCIGRMNATASPKLMQRGQYDSAYFLRWNVPLRNYLHDTYNLQHCMYCELAADLGFMTQMYTTGIRYWKEQILTDKLEYNARDTHATLCAYMGQHLHIREYGLDYALRNYMIEFPLVFPCLHSGLEGIAVDAAERERLKKIEEGKRDAALQWLRTVVHPAYNPGSPLQTANLLQSVGYTEAEGTGKKEMQQFAEAHPLYALLTERIQAYRNASKAVSTYYEFELLHGRLLYEIDPAGTDTGRCASKASQFWCGTQIQNIPAYSKGQFVADPGWLLAEPDGAQAESRCTAYISQDENLQRTVETSPDFHCTNASLFFGIPFEELYSVEHSKVLRNDIRSVAKRVNHGANYNMGAYVMWETMGTREVLGAKRLLGLPEHFDVFAVCKTLLQSFSRTYPKIKGEWYGSVQTEVLRTGRLVGATGWTRRTFLRPDRNKLALNSCIAHPPQSLSVMLVNRAMLAVWKLQIGELAGLIRLKAQVHDSLFFQYKEGREDVVHRVSAVMREQCTVQVHGKTMTVPNAPKCGGVRWNDLKD